MSVDIFKLDGEELLNTFPTGSHILGRGPSLQCNDKRVSRSHATIDVTPDSVQLTSTHINPCFIRLANSKTITILAKDNSKELNDGDAFAFLPDDFWFKVKVSKEEVEDKKDVKTVTTDKDLKRCSSDEEHEDAPPDKKIKIEEKDLNIIVSEEPSSSNKSDENLASDETENKLEDMIEQKNPKQENNDNNNPEPTDENDKNVTVNETEPDQTTDDQNQVDAASTSDQGGNDNPAPTPQTRKEKCWYGAQCYRKNPVHRQDFTHPGDSDYESDQNDSRPTCSFGADCYRKNKDHRKQYKHPPRQPGKKKRNRKKVDRLNVADSEEMRELSDSDSEDPFLADDDSDEYAEESDNGDSDWEDSQEVDEDGDNVKRLVREAKRFVKK